MENIYMLLLMGLIYLIAMEPKFTNPLCLLTHHIGSPSERDIRDGIYT